MQDEEALMVAKERVVTDGGDAEEKCILRLRALLDDVVRREGGRMGAGRELGIDRREPWPRIWTGRHGR